MINIDKTKKPKIHTRRIDIATYEGGSDSIIVEGVLTDERLASSYRPTGDTLPPGTVHHMIIRMEVRGPKLVIEDIEVEMPTVPMQECLETLDIAAMAPAAVQGAWAAMTSKPRDPATFLPGAMERIKDTCRVWRSDGHMIKNIEK